MSLDEIMQVLSEFEYFSDGSIRRYPEESDFNKAVAAWKKTVDDLYWLQEKYDVLHNAVIYVACDKYGNFEETRQYLEGILDRQTQIGGD